MARPRSAEERFEEIYRRHVDAVFAYARRRAPQDVAEEVAAETFLVCWRRLHRVPENPLPWLYAVARKTLANERRAIERRRATESSLRAVPGDAPPSDREPALAAAFGLMSTRDRELLALVAWEGLTLAEAAASLGCSTVACRVRFHRAKRRLAERLAELEAEHPVDLAQAPPVARRRQEGVVR